MSVLGRQYQQKVQFDRASSRMFEVARSLMGPWRLGLTNLWYENDFLTADVTITIEFRDYPEFKFSKTYPGRELVYIWEPVLLAEDFGEELGYFIRNYRIEPDSHIELGEN